MLHLLLLLVSIPFLHNGGGVSPLSLHTSNGFIHLAVLAKLGVHIVYVPAHRFTAQFSLQVYTTGDIARFDIPHVWSSVKEILLELL